MPDVPPKLGPFEPRYLLGAGGMAQTFVAVRRGPAGFEQRVCLKCIRPEYAHDPEFVRAFRAEARTSATLRHANIVQVLDFGDEGTRHHYLALELIDGLDLRALMQRDAELDAELAALIGSEIAHALEHAHGEGRAGPVVHRDISPANVLVSRAGEVKLTDFGIAHVLGATHHTKVGVIKGKAPYMPPEYIRDGAFDVRSDLFAVGVLLFELLHGERPFGGDSEIDTLRRIVAGERRPFTAQASAELRTCIERLLEIDPEARFQSARELLDALPPVPVNQARKRLAALVRARTSSLDDELARRTSLPVAPTEPAHESPGSEPPTRPGKRTRSRGRSRMPSRAALLALGCSLALFSAVATLGLWRLDSHAAEAPAPAGPAPAREPPSAPAAVAVPPPASAMAAAPGTAPPPPAPEPVQAERAARGTRRSGEALAELQVVAYPFGDVWVDDKYLGASPRTLRLSAGTHVVAVGEGRPRERRSVEVHAGEHQQVVFGDVPGRPRR